MDTKKFQRANEIMDELKKFRESLENLKKANHLVFSISKQVFTMEQFCEPSHTFITCRDIAISECEKRIAQLEKEFNEL